MSIASNIRAGRAYVEVTADTSKLGRGLAQAQAQLRAFGQTCTNVGRDLLVLSGAMAAPFAMAVRSFANFDDTMRLAQAVVNRTVLSSGSLSGRMSAMKQRKIHFEIEEKKPCRR